MKAPPKVWLC